MRAGEGSFSKENLGAVGGMREDEAGEQLVAAVLATGSGKKWNMCRVNLLYHCFQRK